jgi:hypothetical protein
VFDSPVLAAVASFLLSVGFIFGAMKLLARSSSWDADGARRLWVWVTASFVLHLALGCLGFYTFLITYLAPDAGTYNLQGLAIMNHWLHGTDFPRIVAGKDGFSYLLAGLYTVMGAQPVFGLVVNAAMTAALIPVVTDTFVRLFPERRITWVPAVIALVPSLIIWPGQLIREAGALLCVAVLANVTVRLNDGGRIRQVILAAVAITLLLSIRAPVALVAGAALAVGSVASNKEHLTTLARWVAVGGLVVVLVLTTRVGYRGTAIALGLDLGSLSRIRNSVSSDSVASPTGRFEIDSPVKALIHTPVAVIRFLFGPFPWEVTSLRVAPALGEWLVWLFLVPSLAIGVWRSWRERLRISAPVLLAASVLTVSLALASGNYGLALRERMQVIVLLAPFIALGLLEVLPRILRRRDKDVTAAP